MYLGYFFLFCFVLFSFAGVLGEQFLIFDF